MDEQELKRIEDYNESRFVSDLARCHEYNTIRKLIAEVRRLRAENERLEREHATYAEVKTDRNIELKQRIDEMSSEIERLKKQREEFEEGIRF